MFNVGEQKGNGKKNTNKPTHHPMSMGEADVPD